jgi:hypothetical protein
VGSAGQRERERERASACARVTTPTGRPHRAARGREEERRCGVGADRRGPPVRDRGRGGGAREAGPGGLTGPNWLFYFSREFLIAFLLIFSRVFNSNLNQVSNLNQIKHVQQIKEYLELNMMQHFMTHIVLKKIK